MTAPALRRLSITGELVFAIRLRLQLDPIGGRKAHLIDVVTFTVIGTPPRIPASPPFAIVASIPSACASTSSGDDRPPR
jgi:hypothetical protein